jgi:hypothetical protein
MRAYQPAEQTSVIPPPGYLMCLPWWLGLKSFHGIFACSCVAMIWLILDVTVLHTILCMYVISLLSAYLSTSRRLGRRSYTDSLLPANHALLSFFYHSQQYYVAVRWTQH